ncbi:hypothetical protein ERJ75_001629800 [Trypanosoma vivax]|nr:hypothetical protein ERJ75_001629800 [Trypanosoma vivax]
MCPATWCQAPRARAAAEQARKRRRRFSAVRRPATCTHQLPAAVRRGSDWQGGVVTRRWSGGLIGGGAWPGVGTRPLRRAGGSDGDGGRARVQRSHRPWARRQHCGRTAQQGRGREREPEGASGGAWQRVARGKVARMLFVALCLLHWALACRTCVDGTSYSRGLSEADAKDLCNSAAVARALGAAMDEVSEAARRRASAAAAWGSLLARAAAAHRGANETLGKRAAEEVTRLLAEGDLQARAAALGEQARAHEAAIVGVVTTFLSFSGSATSDTTGRLCVEKSTDAAQITREGEANTATRLSQLGCTAAEGEINALKDKLIAGTTLYNVQGPNKKNIKGETLAEQLAQPTPFTMAGHSNSYHDLSGTSQKGCPLTQFRSHTSVTSGGVITLAAALDSGHEQYDSKGDNSKGYAWKPTWNGILIMTPASHANMVTSNTADTSMEWTKGATAAMTALAANATQTLATHRQLELACKQKRTTCSTPRQNAMSALLAHQAEREDAETEDTSGDPQAPAGEKRHAESTGTDSKAQRNKHATSGDMRTDTAKGTETQSTCTARGGTWDAQQGQCSTASGQKHRGAAMAAAASLLARTATTTGTRA